MPTPPRRRSAAAARRLRNQATATSPQSDLPTELDAMLDQFRPTPPLAAQWPTFRPLVKEVMASSSVRGTDSFRKYLTHLGYFLLWADDQGLDLSPATVVRAHTDEYTRTGMPASSAKSRSDRRARLRWLADQVNPDQAPDKGIPVPRPTIKAPYTADELTALVRVVGNQPTPERRRKAALCVGLGAGAGLDSSDLRDLRTEHVVDAGAGGLLVHVHGSHPRTVPVRAEFENLVRRGIADIAAGQLLLGRVAARRNIAANALADIVILGDCPRIEQSRLRATWLVTLLTEAVPLATILAAAGLRSARTLPDLLPYLQPVNQVAALHALRGERSAA